MARFNEILAGRYNRFLQKFLSIKGGPPAPQLASEIAAVWSLFHGAENRYLEGWDRYGAVQSQAAVAAQFSTQQFRNPLGSNVVAVFEKVAILFPVLDFVAAFVGVKADEGSLAMVTNRFDNRSRPQPTLLRSAGNDVAAFANNAMLAARGIANQTVDMIATDIQEFPVLPGDSLVIQSQTANTAMTSAVIWRERFLEDSERT